MCFARVVDEPCCGRSESASGALPTTQNCSVPARGRTCSNADVLVPKVGLGIDKLVHQLNALLKIQDFQRHAAGAHIILRTAKSDVLADDQARDLVEERGAAAHVTR